MNSDRKTAPAALRFLSEYGMLLVLLGLCVFFSLVTLAEQSPTGASAARQVAARIPRSGSGPVLIAVRDQAEDLAYAEALQGLLQERGQSAEVVRGEPREARQAITRAAASGGLTAVAASAATSTWALFGDFKTDFPALASVPIVSPERYRWPNFLKTDNLLNVANQIAVIAILAIGMTMVIITGGIDLSVGSLIALAAVVGTLLIRSSGGVAAAPAAMVLACLAAILLCALIGIFSGGMITFFGIPPFIVTLGMMLVASGLAYILASGQSVYQVPDSFVWLGRGADLGLPNAVLLMLALYLAAHFLMARTRLGRNIYAVGSNREAARLSGVPVPRVVLFVYAASGLLAGLGGVVMASQLKSGSPTYGQMYELYVIAAVVVGGTSLSGGKGKMLGTLIGAFIIAVIQNGMNLLNVESFTQKVVLGLVILGAVLIDRVRDRGWRGLSRPD